ncbi:glycosyltransferase family 2 protein [Actinospica sp.]|jgi:GT2 family glycosyltransferase|uniref:glycosyltransferase family 2 protein n=1 Tax=Actinospica sp. TaxID=1872142 RepID=UPI002C5AF996|nr:glycosyltransferase family 2 protein [Actinospica sp.]HWG25846.1 glycosyltransferase family 2 protein [Actinospica sp.]
MVIDPRQTPIQVAQVDVDAPDRPPATLTRTTTVLALVRMHRHPLGVIGTRLPAGSDLHSGLRTAACTQLGPQLAEHARRDWIGADSRRPPTAGAAPAGAEQEPPCRRARAAVLADPPPITVIIATRERPAPLARCLASLAALDYPRYEVLVVDNDPESDATRRAAEHAPGPVRYLRTRRRGVAVAHNLGAREATGGILAFTDDDVTVDRDWLAAIAETFTDPHVGCVTGLIMPGELETPQQAMLERRGGYGKGFTAKVFPAPPGSPPDPGDRLFPFTAGRMGSGANMAFDAELLARLHGFDPALGPGTPARAGEDLLALFRAAAAGRRVVYQPDALVWHHHRRDPGALEAQARGYGIGLGAYLTSALVHEPKMLPVLLRLLPDGVRYALRNSSKDQDDPAAWPRHLSALERRGLIRGPAAYAHSRWTTRYNAVPERSR